MDSSLAQPPALHYIEPRPPPQAGRIEWSEQMNLSKPGANQRGTSSRRQTSGAMPGRPDPHQEAALDEALAESFPASDPVAVSISTAAPDANRRIARSSEPPS